MCNVTKSCSRSPGNCHWMLICLQVPQRLSHIYLVPINSTNGVLAKQIPSRRTALSRPGSSAAQSSLCRHFLCPGRNWLLRTKMTKAKATCCCWLMVGQAARVCTLESSFPPPPSSLGLFYSQPLPALSFDLLSSLFTLPFSSPSWQNAETHTMESAAPMEVPFH